MKKTQTCDSCHTTKPLEDFPEDNRFGSGVSRTCRTCRREKRKHLATPSPTTSAPQLVTIDAERMAHLDARADQDITSTLCEGGGAGRYNVLLPIALKYRQHLGRQGVVRAVDMFIDEGIFLKSERRAAEVAFRRRLAAL